MSMKRASILTILGLGAVVLTASLASGEGETLRRLNLPGRSDDRPFSHAVIAGDTIYLAGTIGIDPETGRPPEDPEKEIRLVLDGVKAKIELAGGTMDDLVSVQVFCPDRELYGLFNEIYATYFEEGYPVRAFIGSGPLLFDARFEISAIAVRR